MATNWHETFSQWAKPASDTEEEKAARAARMVREALRADTVLKEKDFDLVAMGSYRNNTNVRAASDIDLAAVLRSCQFSVYPTDGSVTAEILGMRACTYGLPEFRSDVNRVLRRAFGSSEVSPGKIAVTIDASTARLGVDVTPYLLHRRYTGRRAASGTWESFDGIESRPTNDPNRSLIQWPEQHYTNGVAKNDATNRRYKRVVRILKRLRDELRDNGAGDARAVAAKVQSCMIEHTVYNVPNALFNMDAGTYYEDVKGTVRHLWSVARDQTAVGAMVEVNGMQKVFREGEPYNAKLLEEFTLRAWQFVGFT